MKGALITLLLLRSVFILGQDTTYFESEWIETASLNRASYYEVTQRDSVDTTKTVVTSYFASGKIKTQKIYINGKNGKLHGKVKEWHENGQLKREIEYDTGKIHGQLLTYWPNGAPKRIATYENDKLISGKCRNSDGVEAAYYDYQIIADFPGGTNKLLQYLAKEARYPKKSKRKGIEGRVLVGFVVNKDGSISNVEIVKGVSDELDEEAIRVVKNMPKWDPGMQDGEAVRVRFNLPIVFRLEQ